MSNELKYLRMGDHDIIPSCLSADPHKPRDFLLHYTGCEQFYQRDEYLASLTPDQVRQVEAQLRRTRYLRDVLAVGGGPAAEPDATGAALVRHLTASLRAWRATREYQDGIVRVRRQRVQYFAVNGAAQRDPADGGARPYNPAVAPGEYNPDKDTNAYLIRFKHGRPVHDMQDGRFHEQYPSHRISIQDLIYGNEFDLSMLYPPGNSINYFHFPANNLHWAKDFITRYLKYKPASELTPAQMNGNAAGIPRYRPATSGDLVPIHGFLTRPILGQKYWKAQQQTSTVTGKYLRPMCEIVAVSAAPEDSQQGVALFMPYLHWDTARHQAQISQAILSETERHRKEKRQEEQQLAGMRRARNRGLQFLNANSRQPQSAWRLENRGPVPSNFPQQHHPHQQQKQLQPLAAAPPAYVVASAAAASTAAQASMAPNGPPKRTATGAFASIMKRHGRFGKVPLWSAFTTDGRGRVLAGRPLGQVLFDAAMLYETMKTHREKSLLRKYLHRDPPLHPRRTLEQTNEWTLSLSWHASARDQVVHRATRPKQLDPSAHHHHHHGGGGGYGGYGGSGGGYGSGAGIAAAVDEPFTQEWMDRIRKVPRVMMIDQLWMWILDEQTIVTCFPDNGDLGDDRHLPGLHRCIRDTLMKSTQGYVRTALDVALLVLSEAQISKASLAMIKPQDAQFVMQIFRQAIRDVASKHSFGAEQYWEWARIFSRLAHTDVDNGLSDLLVPFLDIGKEGELQGQIKSVVRDLEIMLRITTEQKEVVEKFEKTMQQLVAIAQGNNNKTTTNNNYITMPDSELLLDEIQSSIDDLEEMRRSADDISASLDYLISLKQQQVTVVQAWQSMKQGEDNQKQNVTLLVFTVVTVIFLPMSFISSVFGMNNKEIAGVELPMTLATQLKWMFPLSFAIVAITYYTAFGSPGRTFRDVFRWLSAKLGINAATLPGELTWAASLWDRCFRGGRRAKQREKEQAWNRRRSEQLAKENQERRQGRRTHGVGGHAAAAATAGGGGGGQGWGAGGGIFRHGTNTSLFGAGAGALDSPSPAPTTPAQVQAQVQQTGMLGIYQNMNAIAGTRRARTMDSRPEQVV